MNPYGVDLCSGVRTEAHMDPRKLAGLISFLRKADEN